MGQTPKKTGAPVPEKNLRSQYPPNSEEDHVEYILVASFDVDQGSILEHQYPSAISGDENMLAELMLPDQAHARKEDWTIFFLHKDANDVEEIEDNEEEEEDEDDSSKSGDEQLDAPVDYFRDTDRDEREAANEEEAPPLIYVLNLVNTKYDSSAKR